MAAWVNKNKKWLPPQKKRPVKPPPAPPEDPGESNAVFFVPIRCPKCTSEKTRVYSHGSGGENPVRYCVCLDCGKRFSAYERGEFD